ncbi:10826_t:CDS:1, partial [Paraglomus brasilianum]
MPRMQNAYPFAASLMETVRTYRQTIDKVKQYEKEIAILVTSYRLKCKPKSLPVSLINGTT